MPIKFYCDHCGQKMSIGSRKAGAAVNCPRCQKQVTVPNTNMHRKSADDGTTVIPFFDEHDFDDLLGTPADSKSPKQLKSPPPDAVNGSSGRPVDSKSPKDV